MIYKSQTRTLELEPHIIPNFSRGYSFFNYHNHPLMAFAKCIAFQKPDSRRLNPVLYHLSQERCPRSLGRRFIAQLEFDLGLRLALGVRRPSCAFWIVHWKRDGVVEFLRRESPILRSATFLGRDPVWSDGESAAWMDVDGPDSFSSSTTIRLSPMNNAWILDSKKLRKRNQPRNALCVTTDRFVIEMVLLLLL